MQRLLPYFEDTAGSFDCPPSTKKQPDAWNEFEIIPYKHPGSDSFDNNTFAWEMTAGKDWISYRPVKVISPADDKWRKYPRRKRKKLTKGQNDGRNKPSQQKKEVHYDTVEHTETDRTGLVEN